MPRSFLVKSKKAHSHHPYRSVDDDPPAPIWDAAPAAAPCSADSRDLLEAFRGTSDRDLSPPKETNDPDEATKENISARRTMPVSEPPTPGQ
ncbi:zinc finger protein Gfi-1b-like isoform X2 [Sphaerodactylus townsendi]|uniref:zinc finger protein Gfi-1b-like isoform X2 n=1 Tax=Sphaerodactylus townsendi TaxID=933632 RepID=UPI002026FE52|nr:zinc finger protein Gfi-1b-like isoform X2 [Sphaerodactylus townsendi]